MDPIELRGMEEADLSTVVAIEAEAFSSPWTEASMREMLRRPEARTLVAAEASGRVVGYAVWIPIGDQAELMNLAVTSSERRRGIGRLLLDRMLERVEGEGVSEVFLEVRPTNEPALHLYREAGFERIGVRRGYYSNPREDAWVLRRVSTAPIVR